MLVLKFHGLGKVQSTLAAEQECFNPTDLPALNRRDFTACIFSPQHFMTTFLPRSKPDLLLIWNGTSSTSVPDLAVCPCLQLTKFTKELWEVFSLNLGSPQHSTVLSCIRELWSCTLQCWGSHCKALASFCLPINILCYISLTNMKGIQLIFWDTNYLQYDNWNIKIFWSTQAIMPWYRDETFWNQEMKLYASVLFFLPAILP